MILPFFFSSSHVAASTHFRYQNNSCEFTSLLLDELGHCEQARASVQLFFHCKLFSAWQYNDWMGLSSLRSRHVWMSQCDGCIVSSKQVDKTVKTLCAQMRILKPICSLCSFIVETISLKPRYPAWTFSVGWLFAATCLINLIPATCTDQPEDKG